MMPTKAKITMTIGTAKKTITFMLPPLLVVPAEEVDPVVDDTLGLAELIIGLELVDNGVISVLLDAEGASNN